METVVDASALLFAFLGHTDERQFLRRRLAADSCHAPHLVDVELGNSLRKHVLRGALPADDAESLLLTTGSLVDRRYELTASLARDAWALRHNLSFYDATYAALAQLLGLPLLTADARLARAPKVPCEVELVGAG